MHTIRTNSRRILARLKLPRGMFAALLAQNAFNPSSGANNPPAGGGIKTIKLPNPLGVNTFEDFVSRLLSGVLIIAVPLVTLMIVWGAFQMLFSAGSEEKFKNGRKTIVYAIIGLAVVLAAEGLVDVVRTVLK